MVKIAFPKQRAMFEQAQVLILPVFRRDMRIVDEESFGRRFMDFAEIWCVIENIFLATTNEGLAYTMRIPTEIGIGYAAHDAEFPTQIFPAGNIHFNK